MEAGPILQTFAVLLFAHLIADFVLQPERIAINKGRIPILSLHIVIVAATAFLALGYWAPAILIPIAVTHFFIDLTKSRLGTFNLKWFLGDQAAHIAVVAFVSILAPADLTQSTIYSRLTPDQLSGALVAMALGSGFIVAALAGTYSVELFLRPFGAQIPGMPAGLTKGARAAGQLERLLVFVFVVSGNLAATGLLIVARAILAHGEIRACDGRKTAEYIIIGTLFSFAWAIAVSQLAVWAARLF